MAKLHLSYAADLLCAAIAVLVGFFAFAYFHTKWFYGGWMMLFGDPPMGNLSYGRLAPLFEAAPYVAAGLAAGIVSGFGRPQPLRLLVRFLSLVFLFLLVSSRNDHLAFFYFVPSALSAFVFSVCLSISYFWLLSCERQITVDSYHADY